ncbi:MAG: hypothetical protein AD742_21615 [Methylibium sp. NZG]|nr:MAG: hypothetical protein AD742_21615 [Methylibium sp. NZG]
MSTIVNIHEAKTHLSRLVDRAAKGEEFIIAKAGKPLVRVAALHPVDGRRALGGLAGKYALPDDIKAPFADEIATLFLSKP